MKILASFDTPRARATAPGRVILVDLEEGYHPLVTWWQNAEDGGKYHGHYFKREDLAKAEADFRERTQRGF